MYNHLIGKEVPPQTYVPMKYITKDTLKDAFTWEMNESFIPIAEKYMETGKF